MSAAGIAGAGGFTPSEKATAGWSCPAKTHSPADRPHPRRLLRRPLNLRSPASICAGAIEISLVPPSMTTTAHDTSCCSRMETWIFDDLNIAEGSDHEASRKPTQMSKSEIPATFLIAWPASR